MTKRPETLSPDITRPLDECTKRLSVIIVNWNTVDLLRVCLQHLEEYRKSPECEIIVVDNASSDDSAAMVAKEFPDCILLAEKRNHGFAGGNNIGLKIAVGRYLLLLNSDTEVRGNALLTLCDLLDSNPNAGACGPKLLNPDGTIQASCRSFPTFRTALFNRKSILTRLFPNNKYSRQYLLNDYDRGTLRQVDWVIAACILVRREVLNEIQGLDEGFFMYSEDVDWCYRMHKAGWTILYDPSAVVMHHYEKSSSMIPVKMALSRHKSMWRFYRKHYSKNIVIDILTGVAILTRLLMTIALTTIDKFSGRK